MGLGFKVKGLLFSVMAPGAGRRAQGRGRREEGYFKVLRKLVIFLLSKISLGYIDILSDCEIMILLSKTKRILAHSKIERLEIFKKLATSLSEKEP